MSDPVIREASETDLSAIGALHHASRASTYADIIPPEDLAASSAEATTEWWRERWRWEREEHRLVVAVVDGEVRGFTYAGPDEEPGTGILHAIHVAPAAVGSGLGRLLLDDAVAWLATHWDRATLWVLAENGRARGFYEHLGWALDGTTREGPIGTAMVQQVRYARPLG